MHINELGDGRATLRLGGGGWGGGTVSDSIFGGGGTRHLFLLTLYNSKNIGGHVLPASQSLELQNFFVF